uniref:Uncharacterized protein n=1 Tax=Brassica campestris TaxID=3711 RepID=M4FJ61_BRACM
MFCNKLDVFGGDPRVVVGTNINPKIVGDYVCDLMNSLQVCSHLHSLQIWFGKTYSFQESSSAGISSSGLAINKSRVSAAVKVFKKA